LQAMQTTLQPVYLMKLLRLVWIMEKLDHCLELKGDDPRLEATSWCPAVGEDCPGPLGPGLHWSFRRRGKGGICGVPAIQRCPCQAPLPVGKGTGVTRAARFTHVSSFDQHPFSSGNLREPSETR
jgi:hypothetical protein